MPETGAAAGQRVEHGGAGCQAQAVGLLRRVVQGGRNAPGS